MDRLTSMAAFVKAADLGSFAAAASELGMSPQMVAKHVQHLEHRLGARLINRTTRRQSLTELGRTYHERCRLVLADADWADAAGLEALSTPRGRLRVSAPVTFGSTVLTPMVAGYLRANPQVQVDLFLSDREVDLVDEGFEAVIRIGDLPDSSMVARELRPFRLCLCAAPSYLRDHGAPATPEDLKTHECLTYARGPGRMRWRLSQGGLETELSVAGRLRVNSAKALLSAAVDGFGIAMLAEELAQPALLAGDLQRLLPQYEAPPRPMHLLYLGDRHATPKLRSFIDAVLHCFKASAA